MRPLLRPAAWLCAATALMGAPRACAVWSPLPPDPWGDPGQAGDPPSACAETAPAIGPLPGVECDEELAPSPESSGSGSFTAPLGSGDSVALPLADPLDSPPEPCAWPPVLATDSSGFTVVVEACVSRVVVRRRDVARSTVETFDPTELPWVDRHAMPGTLYAYSVLVPGALPGEISAPSPEAWAATPERPDDAATPSPAPLTPP